MDGRSGFVELEIEIELVRLAYLHLIGSLHFVLVAYVRHSYFYPRGSLSPSFLPFFYPRRARASPFENFLRLRGVW